jgi:hypothetical protein
LCLYRVVFGITAKESRPASVELTCWCWRPILAYLAVLFARCVSHMIAPRLACLGAPRRHDSAWRPEPGWATIIAICTPRAEP